MSPDVKHTSDPMVGVGPITVPPSEEKTVCIVVPLGNTEDFLVHGYDATLAPGSHHLILYQTNEALRATPSPCVPFAGIALGTDTPLVFVNKLQENWAFPDDIAQRVPANARVKIEAHYINPSASTLQGQGAVTLHGEPASQASSLQEASFIFWGTVKIDIPPNASWSTGPLFQSGIAGTHLLNITTHQHRLGTGIQVWESSQAGQAGAQIANDRSWSNPSWRTLEPQFDFDGTNGLTFQCDWTNTTDQTVTSGESALDEMCFVGGYYYPGKKLDFCVAGKCNRF
jgi:hypothetical protein